MTGIRRLLAFALALTLAGPALAWNAAGHRLVASLAWSVLDEGLRSEVAALLRAHPDYPRWARNAEKRAGRTADGDERNEGRGAFVEASTWADDIRRDRRFYDAGRAPPTPPQPGFSDMERRRDWHYVNRPLSGGPASPPLSGALERQLAALSATLAAKAPPGERAYALVWLIHLVGDAHQPLHAALRVGADGVSDADRDLVLDNPFGSRKRATTLHAFWDDLPGPPWLRGEALAAASRALAETHLPSAPPRASPAQWLAESWQIAAHSAYPPIEDGQATISADFYEQAQAIAQARVALAGYRLAELLRDCLRAPRGN